MKTKTCFIIFAHSLLHSVGDIDDIINNISYFHDNCDFMVNHPTLNHPKIRTRHMPGILDRSNFIFGALIELFNSLTIDEIESYDHFCLVSGNQFFINDIVFEKGVNLTLLKILMMIMLVNIWIKQFLGFQSDNLIYLVRLGMMVNCTKN